MGFGSGCLMSMDPRLRGDDGTAFEVDEALGHVSDNRFAFTEVLPNRDVNAVDATIRTNAVLVDI